MPAAGRAAAPEEGHAEAAAVVSAAAVAVTRARAIWQLRAYLPRWPHPAPRPQRIRPTALGDFL